MHVALARASHAIEQHKVMLEKQHGIRIEDYPLTQGFYLLARRVGAAEFSAILKDLSSLQGRD